jgi:hypothetical protein
MDGTQLDGLARMVGAVGSRRRAIRLAGAGILAGVVPVLAAPVPVGATPVQALACNPVGTRCGRRRRGKRRQPTCTKCCSDYTITQSNGQRRCACMPDYTPCRRPDQCCSGICAVEDCGCGDEPPTGPVCLPGFLFGLTTNPAP